MRTAAFVMLTAILALSTIGQGNVLTGPVTNPANGHQYYLLGANTPPALEAEAVSLGGHLVTINDEAENTWLCENVATSFNDFVWIGLNDATVEGEFVWTSGDPSTYRNWYAEGDNSAARDYVILLTDNTREWIVFPTSSQHGLAEVVPEPSSCLIILAAAALRLPLRSRETGHL